MDDLKECPFCGSKDIRFMGYPGMYTNSHCQCKDCNTIGPAVFVDDEKAATEAWNRRAVPQASAEQDAQAKLEAVRQAADRAQCNGGECGTGGYCDNCPKQSRAALAQRTSTPSQADREAEQRKRIQERFANRPKTPATADFDLPYASNSDGHEPTQADESGLLG